MSSKIIVDIESYLELMEPICLKYRKIKYDDLLFVNGIRLPLEFRCESGSYPREFISNRPFHPIVAAGLAKELLLFGLAGDKYKKLMRTNPLLEGVVSDSYIPESKSSTNIIYDFLGDHVEIDDVDELENIFDQMLLYLRKFNIPNDKVLDIDIEKNYTVINIGENIAYLRMMEANIV